MAALAEEAAGNTAEVYPFRLPHDLWDNFAAAGWRRPEVYLDPDVRAGMSAFALAKPRAIEEGVGRLRRDLAGVAGRLDRALRNFGETFPLFVAVILVVHVTDTHDALTEWGARLYLWGRVAYVLLYAAGVPLIRSLVWNVATIGIGLIVAALLFG